MKFDKCLVNVTDDEFVDAGKEAEAMIDGLDGEVAGAEPRFPGIGAVADYISMIVHTGDEEKGDDAYLGKPCSFYCRGKCS